MAQPRDMNRNITLEVIRTAEKPVTVNEIAERALAMGATCQFSSFSPSLNQWYHKADKGWQHVDRRRESHPDKGGVFYVYFFNGENGRQPETRRQSTKSKSKNVTVRENPQPPSSKSVQHQTQEVAFGRLFKVEEHGFILVVDHDGNVIKGRYLTEQ